MKRCFWSFWSSNGGPWSHVCKALPPWMWIRLKEEADLVWVGIYGCRNMILIAFKGVRENASTRWCFWPFLGFDGSPGTQGLGSWICYMTSLEMGEIGGSSRLGPRKYLGPQQYDFNCN